MYLPLKYCLQKNLFISLFGLLRWNIQEKIEARPFLRSNLTRWPKVHGTEERNRRHVRKRKVYIVLLSFLYVAN